MNSSPKRYADAAPSTVNDLIAACHTAARHYEVAADAVDDVQVGTLFARWAATLRDERDRLEAAARQGGMLPKAPPQEAVEIDALLNRAATWISSAPRRHLLDDAAAREADLCAAADRALADAAPPVRAAVKVVRRSGRTRRVSLDRLRRSTGGS